MPDQLNVLAAHAIGILAALVLFWVIRRLAEREIRWFLEIVQASDAELAARPIRVLERDRKRMGSILVRVHQLAEINPSRRDGLTAEQYARLVNALNAAVRAVHADIEPGKTSGPEQYAADPRT